jgi:hypothetical protein
MIHRLIIALGVAAVVCLPARAQEACAAPAPVCAARSAVFAISTPFDPLASATLIAPGLLVTNRHVVADESRVEVRDAEGAWRAGTVVPSAYKGDLVLVRVPGLEGEPRPSGVPGAGKLYPIGVDVASGLVRVFAAGQVNSLPAVGKPLARLHHSAASQPGTSGGALVDGSGRLVGILAAGGERRNDAIPVSRLAELEASSGAGREAESSALGRAYRGCIDNLGVTALDALEVACRATGNRQLLDLVAQSMGGAGRYDDSARLFRVALELDPNSLNTLIGLAVTLHRAQRWEQEVAVLSGLIERLPSDFPLLRMSLRAGKFAGDKALSQRALALIGQHHPDALDAATQFLAR